MQGAYQIIEKASGLAWGGKSGDAPAPPVEGGRRRGREDADTSRSASTYRGMRIIGSDHLEVDYNVRTLPTGLEGATHGCEGYGELTFQSMEKILDELKRLPSQWVMDCSSSFVDIGSGYGKSATCSLATALLALPSASPTGRGLRALSLSTPTCPRPWTQDSAPAPFLFAGKPVVHAALYVGVKSSIGVECVPSRHQVTLLPFCWQRRPLCFDPFISAHLCSAALPHAPPPLHQIACESLQEMRRQASPPQWKEACSSITFHWGDACYGSLDCSHVYSYDRCAPTNCWCRCRWPISVTGKII